MIFRTDKMGGVSAEQGVQSNNFVIDFVANPSGQKDPKDLTQKNGLEVVSK
jgi:DNA primase